jgi:molecular chaperone IbpA
MSSTFDFSPLFRSSIGFDRMLNALEAANRTQSFEDWPAYDIVKTGENAYRITMAVAGFAREELTITQEHNMLMVTGRKSGEDTAEYLHHGIADRFFERRFELADHVRVDTADLADGLLTIDLKREIPEELKPRRIEIAGSESTPKLEAKANATKKSAA